MSRGATLITLVSVLIHSYTPAFAECTVEETTVMGEPAIVVENDFLRLRVRPTIGGRIDELYYKPADRHLTSRTDGAVFVDRIWNYANADLYRQWTTATYTYTVDAASDHVAITLSSPGFVGPGRFMTFEKTISISADSSAVRADYRFSVAQDAMQALRVGLWWHNRLGVPQEANTYYVPTTEGVKSTGYGAGGGGQWWWYEPARGWSAVVSESGAGVAAITDLAPLMCFYNWMSGDVASLEWAFRTRDIPNGSSVETTAWLIPFGGMGRIVGAGEGIVVGLGDAPEQLAAPGELPLTVQLAVTREMQVQVRMTARRLPDGAPTEIASWRAGLAPGRTAEQAVTATLNEPGTWLLEGEVFSEGRQIADFFHSVVVSEASGQVVIEPNVERIGRVGERFEDKIAAKGTGPQDRHPSEEIVTPHVKWARPLKGGPLRALILNDLLVGRETVELAQRLDLDYDAPTISSPNGIGRAAGMFMADVSMEWAMDNVRSLLAENDYDVILVGGMSCEIYPEDVIAAILQQVRDGAGLVWVNPNRCPEELWRALPLGEMESASRPTATWRAEKAHWLTAGIPWEALPPTQVSRYTDGDGEVLARADRYPLLAVREYGAGRVVGLGYNTSWQGPGSYANGLTPWIQFAPTRFDYWEYYHSLLTRCMVWAARREPDPRIVSLAIDPAEPVQGEAAPVLRLSTANGAAVMTLQAEVRVVDEFGGVEQSKTERLNIAGGPGENEIELPANLPGGLHLVDVILRDDTGVVVDWGSTSFRVIPRVELSALEVEDRIYREGEQVEAQVTLTPLEPATAQIELVGFLRDAHGRLIARTTQQTAPTGQVAVALDMPEPLATSATLRIEARDGETLLDAAEQTILTMPRRWEEREWEPWLAAMWGNPAGAYSREYLAKWEAQRLRRLGIEAVTTSSNWLHDGEQRNNFEHGFRLLPLGIVGPVLHTNRVREGMTFNEQREAYTRTHDKQYLQRPYPLQAEETRALVAEKISAVTEATARYRPVGYSCGDELSVTYYVTPFDYDFSPVALEHFRRWLQDLYPSLAALNAEWETDFATWDEVMPMTAEEVRDRGNYAPWADHRTFMEFSFAEFFDFVDSELEAHDPGARVGISGTQAAEAYGGYDWWRLTEALDFGQTYDHKNTGIMHRSFHDFLTAPWWGYSQTDPALSYRLWRRLLEDNDGASYYTYNYVYWPDYTWTQSTADAIPHLDDIQGGLARLLDACSERETDVWMHYSQPSIHGAWITGGQSLFSDNRGGWVQAIEDNGMQVSFLAYRQLETGLLTEMMPKVFLLPYSVALSEAEVAEIERYVRAGGTIIADARIGLMDEHCRPRAAGALDELFGVRHRTVEPGAALPEGAATFSRTLGECDPTGVSFEGFGGEDLEPAGGQVLGEMAGRPALIVNEVGEGRAVLLNFFLDSYGRRRELGVGEPMRKLVAEVLELAGVRPPIPIEVSGDHFVYAARYRDGDSRFVGIVRDTAEGGAEVRLTLPAPAHVYDTRARRYLGRKNRIATPLGPGECKIYALLPYQVRSVSVRPRETVVRQGQTVEYLISVDTDGEPGLHVLRIEVTDPSGEVCTWYGTQLTAHRGVASGEFTLALDDQPGRWTIRATDIATGLIGEATVTVGG